MIKSANTQTYHISLSCNCTCTMDDNGIHADDLYTVSFIGKICKLLLVGTCALLSIRVGAVMERISSSCLCLSKWEGIPNMLVKLRGTWHLLTKFFLFWWVLLSILKNGRWSLPSLPPTLPLTFLCSIVLPPFFSLPSLLSVPTRFPPSLVFICFKNCYKRNWSLLYFLFLRGKRSQVRRSPLSLPPSILLMTHFGNKTRQVSQNLLCRLNTTWQVDHKDCLGQVVDLPSLWSQVPAAWFYLALPQSWAFGGHDTVINELRFWFLLVSFLSARILEEGENGWHPEPNVDFFNIRIFINFAVQKFTPLSSSWTYSIIGISNFSILNVAC